MTKTIFHRLVEGQEDRVKVENIDISVAIPDPLKTLTEHSIGLAGMKVD
jgi:hypothetical protein